MEVYCTPGYKVNTSPELMPAIQRYNSELVKRIYEKSKAHNTEFRVLSEKYGLLKAYDKVPGVYKISYDKIEYKTKNMEKLKKLIKKQSLEQKISRILFFSKQSSQSEPYIKALKDGCKEAGIEFILLILPSTL